MRTLLKHAWLLDNTHCMVPGNILMEGEWILSVLYGSAEPDHVDRVLELPGCTIVPGFIDTDLASRDPDETAQRLLQSARSGVTTVRCDHPPERKLPDAPARLYSHWVIDSEADIPGLVPGKQSGDGVKLSGRFLRNADTAQLQEICRRCEQMGMWVTARAESLPELRKLTFCGITELLDTPVFSLPDDIVMYMVAKGICMTLSADSSAHMTQVQQSNLRKYDAFGGMISLSSGQSKGTVTGQQIIRLLEAGLGLQTAVRSASLSGAVIVGSVWEEGSIQPGKYANLVVLKGNPEENPGALEQVQCMTRRGKLCQVS